MQQQKVLEDAGCYFGFPNNGVDNNGAGLAQVGGFTTEYLNIDFTPHSALSLKSPPLQAH